MLAYFMFFTLIISTALLQKEMSIKQWELYKEADLRVDTEKEVFKTIFNHDYFPASEELVIRDQQILIEYDERIYVSVCDAICYRMIIEIDLETQMIVSLTYE
jgi:hypothetical protein